MEIFKLVSFSFSASERLVVGEAVGKLRPIIRKLLLPMATSYDASELHLILYIYFIRLVKRITILCRFTCVNYFLHYISVKFLKFYAEFTVKY